MNPSPRFLFDECLPAPAIRALAESHQTEFASLVAMLGEQGVVDEKWIPLIATEGRWVVITSDGGRQRSRGAKLPDLCREHNVTHVVITSSIHSKKTADKLRILSESWDRIVQAVTEAPPGTRFRLRYKPAKGSGILRVVLERVS